MDPKVSTVARAAVMITGLLCFSVVAISFSPARDNMIEILGGLTAVVLAVIAVLKLLVTHKDVKDVNDKVDKILNGEMDAKIERVVRRVLEEFTRPAQQRVD